MKNEINSHDCANTPQKYAIRRVMSERLSVLYICFYLGFISCSKNETSHDTAQSPDSLIAPSSTPLLNQTLAELDVPEGFVNLTIEQYNFIDLIEKNSKPLNTYHFLCQELTPIRKDTVFIFEDSVGRDFVQLEAIQERFIPNDHIIDFDPFTIDGAPVYGVTMVRDYPLFRDLAEKCTLCGDIKIKLNGKQLANNSQLYQNYFGANIQAVYKDINSSIIILRLRGGEGYYSAYFIYDEQGLIGKYFGRRDHNYSLYDAPKDCFVKDSSRYQYVIQENSFFSKESKSGWNTRRYEYDNNEKHIARLDLSPVLLSDTVLGEIGEINQGKQKLNVFIGDAQKSSVDSLLYFIKGYYKILDSISTFEGTLKVNKVNFHSSIESIFILKDKKGRQFKGIWQLYVPYSYNNNDSFDTIIANKGRGQHKSYRGIFIDSNGKIQKCSWQDISSFGDYYKDSVSIIKQTTEKQWWKNNRR